LCTNRRQCGGQWLKKMKNIDNKYGGKNSLYLKRQVAKAKRREV
jgi:hypothetical protein